MFAVWNHGSELSSKHSGIRPINLFSRNAGKKKCTNNFQLFLNIFFFINKLKRWGGRFFTEAVGDENLKKLFSMALDA